MTQFDTASHNEIVTRILVWGIIATCVGYDIFAFSMGWRTITAVCREIDFQTGTLFRWSLLAIWLHLFIRWGSKGY